MSSAFVAQARRGRHNALHDAALDGPLELTAALLATGSVDIDGGDEIGWTPLMMAAHGGHLRVARTLLDNGASVSLGQVDGGTALHLSAQQGHLAVSKLLVVEARADLDAVNLKGQTPLVIAAGQGRGRVVRFFIEAGAHVNHCSNIGTTALFVAAEYGHLEVVRQLLCAGADPLLGTTIPQTREPAVPLDVAAQKGHVEVVNELIQQVGIEGCGGATAGWIALDVAAESNHVDVIAVLVDAGVVDNGRALHRACLFGSEAAAKFLVQQRRKVWGAGGTRGAYVENVFQPYRYTPLVSSFFVGPACSPRISRLLVDAGADTTSRIRIISECGGLVANKTPLGLARLALRDKEIAGNPATEETLHRLEAVRRMLLRVAAIHAVSWLWPADVARIDHSAMAARKVQAATETNGTELGTMWPLMRRRAGRRGMVWAILFRHSGKR